MASFSGHRVAHREDMMFCVDRGVRGLHSSKKEQLSDSIKEFDVGEGEGRMDRREMFVPLGHRFMFRGRGQAVFLRSLLRHRVLEWVGKKMVFL